MLPTPELTLLPNFVAEPASLFAHLLRSVHWDERLRARKTASFGVSYNYSGMTYPEIEMPAALGEIGRQIESELGFAPNNCLLNYYPDGDSSMGFHSDSTADLAAGSGVAIVSLGSERDMIFRYKQDRSHDVRYRLTEGSLLFMNNAVQDFWLHAIPRCDICGPRISLTFRRINKATT